MMGELPPPQSELFYQFWLETHISKNHLLRRIDQFLDFTELPRHLTPFYSHTGRSGADDAHDNHRSLLRHSFGTPTV